MGAAQLVSCENGFQVNQVDDPTITDPLDVIVRVGAAGFCRTDIHLRLGRRATGRDADKTVQATTITSEAVGRVVDRSLQICRALGISGDVLLGRFLREVRTFRIYDGPLETHRWSIVRRVTRMVGS